MGHYKKLYDYKYIGDYMFPDNQDWIVEIESVGKEVVTGEKGRKEECVIMRFHGVKKPLILNKTNAKTISIVANSTDTEDWPGVKIALYVDPDVKMKGVKVGGVRVRSTPPEAPKKPEMTPDHKRWPEAVKALKSGKLITDIEAQYFLNPENRERLISEGAA